VLERDDDLDAVPWWDASALRMADAIERSVKRLNLDSQGEFVAILNAIMMQLEARDTEARVVRLLADGFDALAAARPIQDQDRSRLRKALNDLIHRVESTACPTSAR